MEDSTLNVILSRFDRLEEKLDKHVDDLSTIKSRVTAVETKLDPIGSGATFARRVESLGHVATSAITLGIVGDIRLIWPPHVPPFSILTKY